MSRTARMIAFLAGVVLGSPCLTSAVSAQETKLRARGKPGPVEHHKRASKLIRLLELPERRHAAIEELLSLGGAAALDLARALSDPRPEVVQTVAQILRMLGPGSQQATPVLEQLAASRDEKRAYIAKWVLAGLRRTGIILVSASTKGELLELDQKGVQKFALPVMKSIFDAERLANGNYLVACYTQHLVREITPKGKVVWEYKDAKTPMDVDRLPSGNTLIADITGKVVEVDRAGKAVWTFKTQSSYEAERLPTGNTLISEYRGNRVIEVNPAGKIVWKHSVKQPMGIERLPNGNTLMGLFSGRVLEVTPIGKVVLDFASPQSYGVLRLADGDTLVTSARGLARFDKTGKQRWLQNLGSVGSVAVY